MADLEIASFADDREWDRFVVDSPQGSVFATSAFLRALGEDRERLCVRENGLPVLAAPVLLRDGVPLPLPCSYTQYLGPMFSAAVELQPSHRRIPFKLRVLDFLLAHMAGRWSRISFSLHPAFDDARAFQWFHYHAPELGRFVIDLAYSGRLALNPAGDLDGLLNQIRTVRRQEFRKTEALGYTVEESRDCVTLDRLHELTFTRQGIERGESEVRLLRSITSAALDEGFGHCLIARAPTGEAASAVLFLYDHDTAYYLVGANDPAYRKMGTGTWLLIQAIEMARRNGRRYVDFVGINSPNRGDFKTSFGALPAACFNVRWSRP